MYCFLPSTSQPLKKWPSHAALVTWPVSLNTRQATDWAHNHELGSHVWLQLLPVNQKHIWNMPTLLDCPVNENEVCISCRPRLPQLHLRFKKIAWHVDWRGFWPGGGGVLPYKRLIGMCRWMGSHFHDWSGYNGVTISIDLLEWGRKFSDFWGKWGFKMGIRFSVKKNQEVVVY